MYEGKILDGRNRYRACIEIEVEPKYRNLDNGDPVAYVTSMNLKRRHLTTSQLATIAVKLLPLLEEEAKKRQISGLKQGDKKPVVSKSTPRAFLLSVGKKWLPYLHCMQLIQTGNSKALTIYHKNPTLGGT